MFNFCPYLVNKSTVFCLYSIHICWISDSLQFYHCPSFLTKTLHTSKSCLMIRNPKSAPYSMNDTSVLQLQALPLLRNLHSAAAARDDGAQASSLLPSAAVAAFISQPAGCTSSLRILFPWLSSAAIKLHCLCALCPSSTDVTISMGIHSPSAKLK